MLAASLPLRSLMAATLNEEKWIPESFDAVAYEWVRGEQHKLSETIPTEIFQRIKPRIDKILQNPDRNDPEENAHRRELLNRLRFSLLRLLPLDTQWYRVEFLRDCHLDELRVIGCCGWDSDNDENELHQVAARWPEDGKTDPRTWASLVLWGHQKDGPFTIMEGNHRLVFHARHRISELVAPVLIGLSDAPCPLHKPDPSLWGYLMQHHA